MRQTVYIWSALLLFLSALPLRAQIVSGGERRAEGGEVRTSELLQLPTLRLPVFDQDSALMAMEQASAELRTYVFAHTLPAGVDIIQQAEKSVWSDGTQVWRYRVRSAGAKSLGFFFSTFDIPEGAYLYVYSTLDNKNVIGGFGSENNNAQHSLPVQPIFADDVIIELQAPKGSPSPRLYLQEVHHGVRSLKVPPRLGNPKSLLCTPELACYPEYSEVGKSVVLIMVDGKALGTGVMVNNSSGDGRPLILTAAHVISSNFSKVDVTAFSSKFLYFFGYQTPMCDGSIQPSFSHSIAGSSLLAYHPYTDTGLIELNQRPPVAYPAYYSGWNAKPNLQETYFNIHHPYGFTKRVNLYLDHLTYGSFPGNINPATAKPYPFGRDQHLFVKQWTIGTTASCSSGSPLFDSGHRVIGVLTGGQSSCAQRYSDQFASLERVWASSDDEARKLVQALDPSGKGQTTSTPGRTSGNSSQQAPVRVTNMSIPPSTKPVLEILPQLGRAEVVGAAQSATVVAERYRVAAGSKIYGAYLMLHGKANNTDRLQLNLYFDGSTTPAQTFQLPLSELGLNLNDGRPREVYLSFEKPITVSSEQTIHFGLALNQLPAELSIVHQQHEDASRGTAQWLVGSQWVPATVGGSNRGLSLWIDPLLSNAQLKPQDVAAPHLRLTPALDGQMLLTLGEVAAESVKNINVYTLQGQRLFSDTRVGMHFFIPRNLLEGVGVVIIHVETPEWSDRVKAYFPKN